MCPDGQVWTNENGEQETEPCLTCPRFHLDRTCGTPLGIRIKNAHELVAAKNLGFHVDYHHVPYLEFIAALILGSEQQRLDREQKPEPDPDGRSEQN